MKKFNTISGGSYHAHLENVSLTHLASDVEKYSMFTIDCALKLEETINWFALK